MLPKRSTPVDQTLGYERIHSPLSIAIFIASRNCLGAQKVLCTKKVNKISKSMATSMSADILPRYIYMYVHRIYTSTEYYDTRKL